MKIFLSHSSKHIELVREFMNRMPKFIDWFLAEDDIPWAEEFANRLESEIRHNADYVLVFLHPDALDSRWVQKELDWALDRETELARPFVLPIAFLDTPKERLRPELGQRELLGVRDSAGNLTSSQAIATLAQKASEKLFHLVTEALTSLDKTKAFQPRTFDHLQGDWHECHFIYLGGKAELVREQWQIDRHEVRATTSDSDPALVLRYSGVIGDDDHTVVARFEAEGRREVVICRLYMPVSSSLTVRGMWFAVDYDNSISCGPEILTRDELDDESARRLLRDSVEMEGKSPLMKLLPYGFSRSARDCSD